MTTAAQMQANRRNAQKSTGPRTPEGKAVVAQNAVKHGLTGREVVIQGEDPGEFEFYRERMLAELDPLGEVEADLADRIVDLSWRLKRAAKLHAVTFDSLYARQKHCGSERIDKKQDADGDSTLGRALVRDFAGGGVLDRLLMYERRIEHSLYRTMAELKRHRILSEVGPGKMWGLRRALASDEGEGKENHGRDARATRTLHEPSCKTNPICPSDDRAQVPGSAELTADSGRVPVMETNPIARLLNRESGSDALGGGGAAALSVRRVRRLSL